MTESMAAVSRRVVKKAPANPVAEVKALTILRTHLRILHLDGVRQREDGSAAAGITITPARPIANGVPSLNSDMWAVPEVEPLVARHCVTAAMRYKPPGEQPSTNKLKEETFQ